MNESLKQDILAYLQTIPKGKVTTYKNIAQKFGIHPRAVASVMRYNRDPITYPCYKVIASSGKISGYNTARGVSEKCEKLIADGVWIEDGRI